jgi:hypothetical protein
MEPASGTAGIPGAKPIYVWVHKVPHGLHPPISDHAQTLGDWRELGFWGEDKRA